MRKLLPIILALVGLGAGMGGGLLLRPPSVDASANPCGDAAGTQVAHVPAAVEDPGVPAHDYVKLNNQFVVPVVEGGRVSALVIVSISLEVTIGSTEQIYSREPKLRDGFLQVLFDHANAGGFKGAFTDANNMTICATPCLKRRKRSWGHWFRMC